MTEIRLQRTEDRMQAGPNDLFEVASNNPPDLEDDDDEVHEPQDYSGEYGLDENEEVDDE